MDASESSAGSGRSPWFIILVIAGVFVLYQGVMYGVRRHVDGEIASSTGKQLFAFELKDLDGKTWRTADLAGRKVVLNFFRSHCQMCSIEAPVIRELARTVDADQVVVLGVMMDEVQGYDQGTTQQTLISMGYTHPVCMANAEFLDAFHGAGWSHVTPVTYVADERGAIVAALRGHQKLATLRAALR